jgi:uridine phosphorylase
MNADRLPRITPEKYLQYLRELGAPAEAFKVSRVAILAWGPLWATTISLTAARRQRAWVYDKDWPHHIAATPAGHVSIFRLPTGAAAAGFLLEQLIASGVATIVGLGLAGGIDQAFPAGTIAILAAALPDEGTSPHYCEGTIENRELQPVHASRWMVRHIERAFETSAVQARTATAWTTDAPFRETPEKISERRRQGASVVDMETSALYKIAAYRGIDICNVVIVSDELWDDWRPGLQHATVRSSQETAVRLLYRVCGEFQLSLLTEGVG